MWIPGDSTMTLGHVIDDDRVLILQQIAQLQQDVETAQDSYNAQLRNKLSLDMSVEELKSLEVGKSMKDDQGEIIGNPEEAQEAMRQLDEARSIQDQATLDSLLLLVKARTKFEKDYVSMMKSRVQTKIGYNVESPLKFNESEEIKLPIGTDTMNMDVQYFRNESNGQSSRGHVSAVSKHAGNAATGRYSSGGSKIEQETEDHMTSQCEKHQIKGTLVITARATHKLAKMYDAKYDATKLVRAWNAKVPEQYINLPGDAKKLYKQWAKGRKPAMTKGKRRTDSDSDDSSDSDSDTDRWGNDRNEEDKLKVDGFGNPLTANDKKKKPAKIAILTGQTYGSSFIGFIHFLKVNKTESHNSVTKTAKSVARESEKHLWFAGMCGTFGLDETSAKEIKSLLSSNSIQSHVCVQTYGIIPSIASQGVEACIKKFSEFSPDATDKKLSMLAGKKNANGGTFTKEKQTAVRAGQIKGMERAKIEAVLSGVREGDKSNNQVLNMNSLMLAFDDYIKGVRGAYGGMPMNYFVSTLAKNDIIAEWLKEFRPDLYEEGIMGAGASDEEESDNEDGERKKKRKSSSSRSSDRSISESETETETESDSISEDSSDDGLRR